MGSVTKASWSTLLIVGPLHLGACPRATDLDTSAGPSAEISEVGDCPMVAEVGGATALTHDVLVDEVLSPNDMGRQRIEVVTDQERWEELEALFLTELPVVDFDARQVLFATAGTDSTCGLELDTFDVVDLSNRAHLDLTVADPTGACEEQCDALLEYVVAVAIDPTYAATVCSRMVNTCED